MAARPDPVRWEAFVQGLARDLTVPAAGLAAGYSAPNGWLYKLAKLAETKDRVAQARRELKLADPSLKPVILALMEAAQKAIDKGDTPALTAAGRLLAEAGRLKLLLPAAPAPAQKDGWLERWGPED